METKLNQKLISTTAEEIKIEVSALTKRIRKAEEDRMAKYYKQVSELNDWRRQA